MNTESIVSPEGNLMTSFQRPGKRRRSFAQLRVLKDVAGLSLVICLPACANMPLQDGTTLSSYQSLRPSNGTIVKSKIMVAPQALATVKTIRIVPTSVSPSAAGKIQDIRDQTLISNAVDRSMCIALSDRYEIVARDQPADLTIRASIVNIIPTNKAMAGVSTVTSLGAGAVLPMPVPRLPIGLGGFDAEAEAMGSDGIQKAAMVWSRGADSLTTAARMSQVGDAYALAGSFGSDFGKMLVEGESPFKGVGSLPSGQKLWSQMGGKSKYTACEAFGRAPGIAGAIGGKLGLPPDWTDKQAAGAAKS